VFLKWVLKSLAFALHDFLETAGSLAYCLPINIEIFLFILFKNWEYLYNSLPYGIAKIEFISILLKKILIIILKFFLCLLFHVQIFAIPHIGSSHNILILKLFKEFIASHQKLK
jgi:hypothetical protein